MQCCYKSKTPMMNMQKHKSLITLLFLLPLVCIVGCLKDDIGKIEKLKGFEIDATWGVPIFNDQVTLRDWLSEADSLGQLVVNPDGYLSYIAGYFSTSLIGNDYIQLSDQSHSFSVSMSTSAQTAFNLAPVGTKVTDSMVSEWGLTWLPLELDSVHYKIGAASLDIQYTLQAPGEVRIAIPGLLRPNGSLFSETFVFDSPQTQTFNLDLSGCKLDFTQGSNGFNEIAIKVLSTLEKTQATQNIGPGSALNLNWQIQNQQFSKVFGFFGQTAISVPEETLNLGIFKNQFNDPNSGATGTVFIQEPKLNLYFDNSFGMSVQIQSMNPFFGRTTSGTEIPVVGLNLPFTLDKPQFVGDMHRSLLSLSSPDVNVNQLMEAPVNQIVFAAEGLINPVGSTRNFALDTSKVILTTEVEIPFYGRLTDFAFTPPKYPMSLPDAGDQAHIIDHAELKLIVENTLPIALSMQMYFYSDSLGMYVDSLFKTTDATQIIPSSSVNAQGELDQSGNQVQLITISGEQYRSMLQKGVNFAEIRVFANTSSGGTVPVKIFPDYGVHIKAGIKIKAKGGVEIW